MAACCCAVGRAGADGAAAAGAVAARTGCCGAGALGGAAAAGAGGSRGHRWRWPGGGRCRRSGRRLLRWSGRRAHGVDRALASRRELRNIALKALQRLDASRFYAGAIRHVVGAAVAAYGALLRLAWLRGSRRYRQPTIEAQAEAHADQRGPSHATFRRCHVRPRGLFPPKATMSESKNGARIRQGELSIFGRIYGNSENTTIRARLRAEAMSRAVSSMIAVLFGSDVSLP